MTKTILITGSTDGIGLATATVLSVQNHTVLLHGRSESKLVAAEQHIRTAGGTGTLERYEADLSDADAVVGMAQLVAANHQALDVLINNAGVFRLATSVAANGIDMRFMVNTISPYLLTRQLVPLLGEGSRVINLSSAAQAPVNREALTGGVPLDQGEAYAQSKLALTMWSNHLAHEFGGQGPDVIAVNPGSFLGTKMVKEAYGTAGKDIGIGVDILVRAATSGEFADASGRYFDNDSGQFASPHPDALDHGKTAALVDLLDAMTAEVNPELGNGVMNDKN